MTPLQMAVAAFTLLSGIIGGTLAIESRYEKAVDAAKAYEYLAQQNEDDRLNTQLAILKIQIDAFVELAKVRALTEAEQIQLRALETQRNVILERLATKG